MPSTVYRGDLSEITFGHESGLVLEHNFGGTDFKFTAKAGTHDLVKDTSVITFASSSGEAGSSSTSPIKNGLLLYPKGMLTGSRLIFSGLAGGTLSADDNYSVKGRSYTIIKHDITASDVTELTITPALKTDHSSAVDSEAGGRMHILPFATPAFDKSMSSDGDNASDCAEAVLTDQFVGLVSTVALPETKVDLKRYHVVGLGRDVAVQVPGRYTNVGGSFECNIHNGRWFYYCLGQKVSHLASASKNNGGATYTVSSGADVGSNYVKVTGEASIPDMSLDSATVDAASGNLYLVLTDANANLVDIQTYRETSVGDTKNHTDAWPNVGADGVFDRAVKQEVRRIIGHAASGSGNSTIHTLWLDEPLQFDYISPTVSFSGYEAGNSISPDRADSGVLTNPVQHLFYSRTKIPSFAMEVSVRRLDQGHNLGTTDGTTADPKQLLRVFRGCKVKDWSLTADTDAALRLSANFDAALCYTDTGRLESTVKATATLTALSKTAGEANTRVLTLSDGTNSVNFSIDNSTSTSTATVIGFSNANSNPTQFATNIAAAVNAAKTAGTLNMSATASTATVTLTQDDTGEAGNTTPSGTAISDSVITLASAFSGGAGPIGDRYQAHRLFEDTATTDVKRKQSGIEKGTQRPFMFYNGTITVLGQTVGQVVSFTLNGKTGVEQFYTISAANVPDSATDQVPHAGTRNPSLAVEGKTEYDMDMEIIVDDPIFYHNMRRAIRNFDDVITDSEDAELIRLSFNKVASATGDVESIDILMDDFFITEASLPIPEDKGPLRSTLKILPKTVKVIAKDTVMCP